MVANRYVILEISPLAREKSPLSPLAFSTAEKRENSQACKPVKKKGCSQYLQCDSLPHLVIYHLHHL